MRLTSISSIGLSTLSVLSLAILSAGCSVGTASDPVVEPGGGSGGGGGGGGGGGEGEGEGTAGLVGTVTEDLSLSGTIAVSGDVTIAAGTTVTIEAGSEFSAAEGVTITVQGSLQVLGSEESRITMHSSTGALSPTDSVVSAWAGVIVESGGAAKFSHVDGSGVATLLYCKAGAVQCEISNVNFNSVGNFAVAEAATSIVASSIETLGTISLRGEGSLSIVDSRIFNSGHDIVVASGGDLSIDHSEIGGAMGSYEHCNLHIGSAATVSVTNSSITSAVYGLMIGGVDGAVFSNNNFTLNETSNVLQVGTVTNANLSGNYWEGGAPADLSDAYDVSNALAEPVVGAGPRVTL